MSMRMASKPRTRCSKPGTAEAEASTLSRRPGLAWRAPTWRRTRSQLCRVRFCSAMPSGCQGQTAGAAAFAKLVVVVIAGLVVEASRAGIHVVHDRRNGEPYRAVGCVAFAIELLANLRDRLSALLGRAATLLHRSPANRRRRERRLHRRQCLQQMPTLHGRPRRRAEVQNLSSPIRGRDPHAILRCWPRLCVCGARLQQHQDEQASIASER